MIHGNLFRDNAIANRSSSLDFMTYAALAFWLFWLSRLSATAKAQAGEAVRIKDPDEFQRIIADRLRREIALDAFGPPDG